MSVMEMNGSAMVAMVGKNCVAIAADRRLGQQAQTLTMDFKKIFQMGPKLMVGLPGLATDVLTVSQQLAFRVKLYTLREDRNIEPKTLVNLVSSLLYERRFGPYFVEPIVAGLDKDNVPFVGSTDLIGCPMIPEDFVVGGTCSEQLYGMCEALWRPDMNPEELFECTSQALINAFDRDCYSGWGAVVHVIEPDKITTRTLKTRMD